MTDRPPFSVSRVFPVKIERKREAMGRELVEVNEEGGGELAEVNGYRCPDGPEMGKRLAS